MITESNIKHQDYSNINIINIIITLLYSFSYSSLKQMLNTIYEFNVEGIFHFHLLLQTVLITWLNHSDELHIIRDHDHHNNKELKNLSTFEKLLFSAIKNEACVMGDKFLPGILNNTLNRSCNKFSTLNSYSNENESASQQDEYQKMMLTGYRKLNCAKWWSVSWFW